MADSGEARADGEEDLIGPRKPAHLPSETERLEGLWKGEFGDAYVLRNIAAGEGRLAFWRAFLRKYRVNSVLEVGCNVGANLRCINEVLPSCSLSGLDLNRNSLRILIRNLPVAAVFLGAARDLPFRDAQFDAVFTAGVLIHQPDEALPVVAGEIVRCSRSYVICAEYYAEKKTEVFYRGQRGALFKRDYGKLYGSWFPALELLETGFLPREEGGWDDVTYWIFHKKQAANRGGKE